MIFNFPPQQERHRGSSQIRLNALYEHDTRRLFLHILVRIGRGSIKPPLELSQADGVPAAGALASTSSTVPGPMTSSHGLPE